MDYSKDAAMRHHHPSHTFDNALGMLLKLPLVGGGRVSKHDCRLPFKGYGIRSATVGVPNKYAVNSTLLAVQTPIDCVHMAAKELAVVQNDALTTLSENSCERIQWPYRRVIHVKPDWIS
jgi:hypothetical protein